MNLEETQQPEGDVTEQSGEFSLILGAMTIPNVGSAPKQTHEGLRLAGSPANHLGEIVSKVALSSNQSMRNGVDFGSFGSRSYVAPALASTGMPDHTHTLHPVSSSGEVDSAVLSPSIAVATQFRLEGNSPRSTGDVDQVAPSGLSVPEDLGGSRTPSLAREYFGERPSGGDVADSGSGFTPSSSEPLVLRSEMVLVGGSIDGIPTGAAVEHSGAFQTSPKTSAGGAPEKLRLEVSDASLFPTTELTKGVKQSSSDLFPGTEDELDGLLKTESLDVENWLETKGESELRDMESPDFLEAAASDVHSLSRNLHRATPQADLSPSLANQLGDAIRLATDRTAQPARRIEVQLDPPELGKVTVELTEIHRGVVARIEASSEPTANLIERQIDLLRQNLEAAGVNVLAFQVGFSFGHSTHGGSSGGAKTPGLRTPRVRRAGPVIRHGSVDTTSSLPSSFRSGRIDIRL